MRKAASQIGTTPRLLLTSGSFILALCASLTFYTHLVYAWSTQQSVTAYCDNSVIKIKATFKNTEPSTSNLGMNVVASDLQTGISTNLGTVNPGQTKEGTIDTGTNSLASGSVRFALTWSNGQNGVDTRTVNYSAQSCPRPTATPTTAPTAEPTVAPTATPTVAPTTAPTAAPTATPVVTQAPTAAPEVRTDLTDNRSDGRKDSLDCVAESKNGRKSCNDAPVPVVAGVSTDSLPSTGEEGSIWAIFSLVALVGGIYAKMLSDKSERTFMQEYEKNRKVTYANLQ